MVSKITKKASKNPTLRRRKKSPAKTVAAVSSLIATCQRRLIKIFSTLVRIGTPSPTKKYKKSKRKSNKNPRKQGYNILSGDSSPRRRLFSGHLPPPLSPEKKTLVLDLDETLIHSVSDPPPEKYDFIVSPIIDGSRIDFYVRKRPFVDEFIELVAKRFELCIFTAGLEEYASLVLDKLDKKGLIRHRLYRGSCREVDGKFVKDLGEIGRDLGRVAIVDDNPNAYALNVENAIPVKAFIDDVADTELKRLMGFFEGCDGVEDMRDVVKLYLAWSK